MRALTAEQVETMIRDAMTADDWATVADLEPRLDRLTAPKPEPNTLDAALWYASLGFHVFPLQPRLKIPYRGTRGLKEATDDPQMIRGWWQRFPDSNVAIATGHLVDVIDIDGPTGVKSWAEATDFPPIIGTASTPRPGGTHLYIRPTGAGNGAKIHAGVDYRGAGGYVLAPPSHIDELRDKNGKITQHAGPYTWRRLVALPSNEMVA